MALPGMEIIPDKVMSNHGMQLRYMGEGYEAF